LAIELFSVAWAARLERELGASAAFRTAAARWRGAIALVLESGDGAPPERAVVLDLARAAAPAVRPAPPHALDDASHVVAAPLHVWTSLLVGEMSPAVALTSGRLRLRRGGLLGLLPHLEAARELLACARALAEEEAGAG